MQAFNTGKEERSPPRKLPPSWEAAQICVLTAAFFDRNGDELPLEFSSPAWSLGNSFVRTRSGRCQQQQGCSLLFAGSISGGSH